MTRDRCPCRQPACAAHRDVQYTQSPSIKERSTKAESGEGAHILYVVAEDSGSEKSGSTSSSLEFREACRALSLAAASCILSLPRRRKRPRMPDLPPLLTSAALLPAPDAAAPPPAEPRASGGTTEDDG